MEDLFELRFVSAEKGKGLFAKKNIKKGTILDEAQLIYLTKEDYERVKPTLVESYTFEWEDPEDNGKYSHVIPMSACEFINHSYNPNVEYYFDYRKKTISFRTVKAVKMGEELTTNYNGDINDKSPLWFEVKE